MRNPKGFKVRMQDGVLPGSNGCRMVGQTRDHCQTKVVGQDLVY
jgi:hypothetical protein